MADSTNPADSMRVTGQPRFAMVPLAVLKSSPRALQVFAALAAHASNDDRRCWPGIRRLATMLGCSPASVHSGIAELEERGLITVVKGEARTSTPSTYDLSPAWAASATGGVGHGGPTPVQPAEQGVFSPLNGTREGVSLARNTRGEPADSEDTAAAIAEVVDHWRSRINPRAKSTADRRRRVRARLREGYTVAELCRAVDGCASSDFHRNGHHQDLELITRTAAHVDRFIALAEAGPARGAGRPPANPRRNLSRDEEVLNDLTAALAVAGSDDERAELEESIASVRARIRAACDTEQATRSTQNRED